MRKLTLPVSSAAITAASLAAFVPATGLAQALEEITVTARKTSESLQEVPLAITAIGSEDISRLGIQDLSQITDQDTSVQFDQGFTPSDTRITIRGLSPTRGRPNAATLVDGIDVTSEAVSNAGGSLLINPRLIDVERIEIVKGPQSALYGRSAFAGAVQYVTKDPADVLSGEVFVEANNKDAKEIRGNVSVPITDDLGVLVNGYAWDARGIYKNTATDDYVGGGNGFGTSISWVYEPTDNLKFKWRTEYSDDAFDVAPQVLLNDRNELFDLGVDGGPGLSLDAQIPGNLSSDCVISPTIDIDGNDLGTTAPGPLDNPGCGDTLALSDFFNNGNPVDGQGNPKNLGFGYDPNDPWLRNIYNKQVVSAFRGTIPDRDELQVALLPNYSFGAGARNPLDANDYPGIEKDVFRTSLVADWAISDELSFTSYTSYLDSTVTENLDLGKYFVDRGTADPTQLDQDYLDVLEANFLDPMAFAPINEALGPDGVHDGTQGFVQNSSTDTVQFSQEFRAAWDISESVNFTTGLLYWKEDVDQLSKNSTTVAGGPLCNLGFNGTTDGATDPNLAAFLELDPDRDQCGRTGLSVAYWLGETFQGRIEQPDLTQRRVNHFSWYGSLDLDLTEKLSARLEARYTNEKNEVRGLIQNPCLDPSTIARTVDGGRPSCYNDLDGDGLISDAELVPENIDNSGGLGAGGQPTGPSAVLICGQVGRCDALGLAREIGAAPGYAGSVTGGPYSYWNWGFRPMPGNRASIEKTDRFWAPKATIEYFWNDDIMTYFSWSRGIKPGGFSLLTSGAFGLDANLDGNFDEIAFDEERLDVWEFGAKTTLFDGRVRLNGSAFFQDFKDKQVTVQAVVANTVGTKVENIDGSEIYGLELDGSWQITEALRFSGGWTYLDSEYTDYTVVTRSANDIARIQLGNGQGCTGIALTPGSDPTDAGNYGCLASFNGNQLERSPKHALLANLNYTNNLFDTGYEWFSEAQWRYQDSRYLEAFNIVEFPAYSITDFRIGVLADAWDVTLFINNVFEEDAVLTGGANPGLPTGSFGFGIAAVAGDFPGVNAGPKLPSDVYAQLPNPRIAGLRVNMRFGE